VFVLACEATQSIAQQKALETALATERVTSHCKHDSMRARWIAPRIIHPSRNARQRDPQNLGRAIHAVRERGVPPPWRLKRRPSFCLLLQTTHSIRWETLRIPWSGAPKRAPGFHCRADGFLAPAKMRPPSLRTQARR
jgi:hypothetical protein